MAAVVRAEFVLVSSTTHDGDRWSPAVLPTEHLSAFTTPFNVLAWLLYLTRALTRLAHCGSGVDEV